MSGPNSAGFGAELRRVASKPCSAQTRMNTWIEQGCRVGRVGRTCTGNALWLFGDLFQFAMFKTTLKPCIPCSKQVLVRVSTEQGLARNPETLLCKWNDPEFERMAVVNMKEGAATWQ